MEFVNENGMTIIKPARGETNPFTAYAGALGAFDTKEEINAWMAELRDDTDDA